MIRDVIRRATSKQLQTMASGQGSKEYTENLLSVASKYKGSALGSQALYEAFVQMRSRKDPELFEVGEALLDQHGASEHAKEVVASMSSLALNTASYDRAARYLSRYADRYPGDKESGEYRKTSASLFERQGDFKKARTQFEKLGDRAGVARMDLVSSSWQELEKTSVESGSNDAKYWQALAIWRQNRYQDAAPLLEELAKDSATTADQVGHVKFLLAQLSLERFRAIQMKSSEDQQSLAEKVKAFKALSSELQSMVESGLGVGRSRLSIS